MSFAASNTTGSIYGKAEEGNVITFTNENTGLSRSMTIGENGRFNFKDLPPGSYKLKNSNGETRDVDVVIGRGSSAFLNQDDSQTITIFATKTTAIDTTSVESTMVFNADQIALLPIARTTVNIALLTPGTVPGDVKFGNLPSFGGSSVAENGYYIDGMDVTNLQTLLSFANLPFDAISQTQVKTGGYGAEYGRSLGGVINTITKSGTNEWQFGAAVYYLPESLGERGKDVIDRSQGDGTLSHYSSNNTYNSLSYNVFAGGPIIEDSLFVYMNLEFQNKDRDNFGVNTSNNTNIDNPNGLLKLDWYITDDHILSATYIQNQTDVDVINYDHTADRYEPVHGDVSSTYTEENGGNIMILNYSGHLTDNLSVSLMYGELEDLFGNIIPRNFDEESALCPAAFNTTGGRSWPNREIIGCWNTSQALIFDPEPRSSRDERVSQKIDFEYSLDDHNVRFGYNKEDYHSFTLGNQFTGGVYYRYFESHAINDYRINGVELPEGTIAVRTRYDNQLSSSYQVKNTAFYIEDNWQLNDEWLIYLGVRNETFSNYGHNGEIFIEGKDLIAPRVGFSWDIEGDSSRKLYGTYGRYFIPIPGSLNAIFTRIGEFSQNYYQVDGWDPVTATPVGQGAEIGIGFNETYSPGPVSIVADTDIEPMHQDELIFGYQQELNDDWIGGIKMIYRKVRNGTDDYCGNDGFYQWGLDNGYAMATEATGWVTPEGGFNVGLIPQCKFINPGHAINILADLNGDGNLTEISVSNDYFDLPDYNRTYKGVELTLEKHFSDGWYANFSYVYSKSEGNIEGYANSSNSPENEATGLSFGFDHARFQDGAQGYLPNDRRHQFKAYGAYLISDELTATANFNMMSGTPLSCYGFIPTDGMLEGDGTFKWDANYFVFWPPSSYYCAGSDGQPVLSHRGAEGRTDWTYMLDVGLSYAPEWADDKLTLQLDVFNIFEFDEAIKFNQTSDIQRNSPEVSPNFLAPTAFQSPRSVRLTARYRY